MIHQVPNSYRPPHRPSIGVHIDHRHQQCPVGYNTSPYHNVITSAWTPLHLTEAAKDVCDDDGDDALRSVFHSMRSCCAARTSFSDHSVIRNHVYCSLRAEVGNRLRNHEWINDDRRQSCKIYKLHANLRGVATYHVSWPSHTYPWKTFNHQRTSPCSASSRHTTP